MEGSWLSATTQRCCRVAGGKAPSSVNASLALPDAWHGGLPRCQETCPGGGCKSLGEGGGQSFREP